jgi:hypothetical protein
MLKPYTTTYNANGQDRTIRKKGKNKRRGRKGKK